MESCKLGLGMAHSRALPVPGADVLSIELGGPTLDDSPEIGLVPSRNTAIASGREPGQVDVWAMAATLGSKFAIGLAEEETRASAKDLAMVGTFLGSLTGSPIESSDLPAHVLLALLLRLLALPRATSATSSAGRALFRFL